MDLSPLNEALFASDDEIEQGFIVALVEAFEERASWPKSFYMSGKGGDIFSERTFAAIGKVLRSVQEEEAGEKLLSVASTVGEGEVKCDSLTVVGKFGSGCSSQQGTNFSEMVIHASSDPCKGLGSISEMGGRSRLGRANKPKSQSHTRPGPNQYPKMMRRVSTAQMRRMYGIGAKITPIYDDDEKYESPPVGESDVAPESKRMRFGEASN